MKILLINPPSPFLLDDRVFPTLGILQVASVLEKSSHTVEVLDLAGVEDYENAVKNIVKNYDVFGLTATTPQFPMAVGILRTIRQIDPTKRVILGGPHATVMPDSCGMFDCIVRGDGERVVLQAIESSAPHILDEAMSTVKGELAWAWPARHLIDMASYKFSMNGLPGTSMMLSQGCPYNCSFCCGRNIPYYRRVRSRNVDDVVAEMRDLMDGYGIQAVMAFDDEVNLLNEPLLEFCSKIKPLGMKFRAFVKANLFNDIQADAMAHAGFVEVCTGVESGDDRILGIINKQTNRAINKRFVDIAHKHGMRAKAFCSLGHAGEDHTSAANLRSWLLETKPDDFDITVITVYPGTPIWDEREKVGVDDSGRTICKYTRKSKRPEEDGATLFFDEVDYAKEFAWYKGIPGQYVSHVWTPDLSKEDLVVLRDRIEDDVRKGLSIPYPVRHSGDNFEHSMAQGANTQDSRVQLKE